jgi:hypothetical protein
MKITEQVYRTDMTPRSVLIAAMLAMGIATTAGATAIAAAGQHRSHSARHHAVTTAAPPARVACTQLGCHPIPAACRPVPQLTWDDLPTGYDAIDCPPGVSPLR